MHEWSRREFAGVLIAAVATPRVFPPRQDLAITPPSEAALAELPEIMDVTGVPGAGIGVVQRGTLSWERYEGVADASSGKAVGAETLFPAASLGKPVFAHAALRLADEGRLDLERPLRTYVPGHAPADPRGDTVTARHVLSHSTGYRNWRNEPDQGLVPDFEPGSRFQYSGEGFYFLQRVVEKITGMAFERFMEERLFNPLGMPSSTYAWRADSASRLVAGHRRGTPTTERSRDFAGRLLEHAQKAGRPLASYTHEDIVAAMRTITPSPPVLPNYIIPNSAGSLLTTVRDYATFLNRTLNPVAGKFELSAATRDQMFRPHTRINSVLAWGLGWGLESAAGRNYIWHWGDNGAFKNFVLAHVPSRSAIVVFTNGSNGMRVAEHLVEAASGGKVLAFDWL